MNTLKILDCTLRDGGYYNDWHFKPELVKSYLESLAEANVDIVEIGFRFFPQSTFLGAFAYTNEDVLNALDFPKSLKVAVMINAKEVLNHPDGPEVAIRKLFLPKSQSKISIVRIASHLPEVTPSKVIAKTLNDLGYNVGFNLMQTGGKSAAELTAVASEVQSWNSVNVLYFADSLGNMEPRDVELTITSLKSGWKGELGIHTHDNMGNALLNSLTAIRCGATYVDATILGMGRGAGNVKTETLLIEIKSRLQLNYNPEALFPLVMTQFANLKKEYDWGANLPYYLSAKYGIHPTYVQELLSGKQYDTHHILDALEFLKNAGGTSYSFKGLQDAVSGKGLDYEGKWDAAEWINESTVVIIGPGSKGKEHSEAVKHFIRNHKPIVIALNTVQSVPSEFVSYYAACHRMKILMDLDQYKYLKKPLIMPFSGLSDAIKSKLSDLTILDYGLKIQPDQFHSYNTYATLPSTLVAGYVLALCIIGKAKKVLLVGFDGYEKTDPRQQEMQQVFDLYQKNPQHPRLLAVTPTTYDIPVGSIYMPNL